MCHARGSGVVYNTAVSDKHEVEATPEGAVEAFLERWRLPPGRYLNASTIS